MSSGLPVVSEDIWETNNKLESTTAPISNWILVDKNKYEPSLPSISALPAGVYRPIAERGFLRFLKIETEQDELITLPSTKSEYVADMLTHFWQSEEKYKQKKQLFKRGVLFTGAPGVGKSATISLILSIFVKQFDGVALIAGKDFDLVADAIHIARSTEPNRKLVVVIEDLDEAITKTESLLLNTIDGPQQVANIVYLATTNYVDELPKRLVSRPSRFDERIEILAPDAESRRVYFFAKLTASEIASIDVEKWVKDTNQFGMAFLKELIVGVFLLNQPYADVLKRLKALGKDKNIRPMGEVND